MKMECQIGKYNEDSSLKRLIWHQRRGPGSLREEETEGRQAIKLFSKSNVRKREPGQCGCHRNRAMLNLRSIMKEKTVLCYLGATFQEPVAYYVLLYITYYNKTARDNIPYHVREGHIMEETEHPLYMNTPYI